MAKFTSLTVVAFLGFTSSNLSQGALIVEFNFNDQNGTADVVHTNADAVTPVFTPGTGLATPTFAASNATARRWNVGSAQAAIDNDRFWEFTVTANAGKLLDLQNITFTDIVGANGPLSFQLEVNDILFGSPAATGSGANIDLSSLGLLSSYTFRIAGFDAPNNSGTATWSLDNVQLNGEVVPEPSGMLLAGVVLPGLLMVRRRKQRLNSADAAIAS